MSEYFISPIDPRDRRAQAEMDELLRQEGIRRDANLDYSCGLYTEDYEMAGTGSCFGSTMRCLAVRKDFQGEGLMNQIVSHLSDVQFARGNTHLFVYTKCSSAKFFADLGFFEIARAEDQAVFMENRRNGFASYLEKLKQDPAPSGTAVSSEVSGTAAVVMNANPFTLGHRCLIETACRNNRLVHLFIVSEDASLVPFAVRKKLVMEGTADLKNIVYHESGPYIISSATFPSYFQKDADAVVESHAKIDLDIFVRIAKALGIDRRVVAEEPFSATTSIYNRIMQEALPPAGIDCMILPRFGVAGPPGHPRRRLGHAGKAGPAHHLRFLPQPRGRAGHRQDPRHRGCCTPLKRPRNPCFSRFSGVFHFAGPAGFEEIKHLNLALFYTVSKPHHLGSMARF